MTEINSQQSKDSKGRFVKGRVSENKGKKFSAEWRKKLSEGRKRYFANGGKSPLGMLGKRHSKEWRKNMSERLKGRDYKKEWCINNNKAKTGSKNPMWRGGVTSERNKIYNSTEYKLWRKSVFERDNYTCRFCNQKGGKLQSDHIKPFCLFPELRFAIDNGRTLCLDCHRKTDTWGGRAIKYSEREAL